MMMNKEPDLEKIKQMLSDKETVELLNARWVLRQDIAAHERKLKDLQSALFDTEHHLAGKWKLTFSERIQLEILERGAHDLIPDMEKQLGIKLNRYKIGE